MLDDEARHGPLTKLRLGLGAILFVIGAGAFLSGFFCAITGDDTPGELDKLSDVQLPLGGIRAIADAQGRIFTYSHFYQRAQLFDAEGKFVRGFHVQKWWFGGAYVDAEGRFAFYLRDGRSAVLDEARGFSVQPGPARVSKTPRPKVEVIGSLWYARITRDGQIVVRPPWWHAPLAGPSPSFAFAVVGMLLMIGGSKRAM